MAIFFRFKAIDSKEVLLYACNGTMYHKIRINIPDCTPWEPKMYDIRHGKTCIEVDNIWQRINWES